MTDPTREAVTVTDCQGFAWIGQPMTSCDNCGRPAWDHDYDEDWGGSTAPFGNDGWRLVPWPSKLIGAWLRNGQIGRERAAALLAVTPPPEPPGPDRSDTPTPPDATHPTPGR